MMYRLVLIWACCALALSACVPQAQEGSDPPPLASASPTVSPSSSKSAAPVDDKAAIVALAREYYLERNQAIRTGSTTRLRTLSTSECPCNAFADGIDADWRKGRVDSPTFYTIVDVTFSILENANTGRVTVVYRKNRYAVIAPSGKVLVNVPAEPSPLTSGVRLSRVGATWKVSDVVRF